MNTFKTSIEKNIILIIIISSLGYFVDAYELWVAALCRGASMTDLSIKNPTDFNVSLENFQNIGLLLGIFWGVLADKIGRVKALYSSILLYSVANILNAFITNNNFYNVEHVYLALRLLSGIGLGAELSVAVTLTSESMSKEKRGNGIMYIISFGLLGTVFAALLNLFLKDKSLYLFTDSLFGYWRIMYFIGGIMGLILLFFRTKTKESHIFENNSNKLNITEKLKTIFTNKIYAKNFILGILLGAPTYFIITLPIRFSKYFSSIKDLDLSTIIIVFFIALSLGDIVSNLISQRIKSRKKVITSFLILTLISLTLFYFIHPTNAFQYQFIYMPLFGFGLGFWVLLNTTVAEMWPTEMRATMSTAIPNIIRALPLLFLSLIEISMKNNNPFEVMVIIGIPITFIAIIASMLIPETFNNDLNDVK